MAEHKNTLVELHNDIELRVQSIRNGQPDWPCRMGCDTCCHRLADIPQLTASEWALLQKGLASMPKELLQEISTKITALTQQTTRPVVCPLLDHAAGACRVYAYRPIACRTYGYYVERDLGLYCKDIENQVAEGTCADVVWGNQEAIDQRLKSMGESRPLTTWFTEWQASV